MVACTCIPKKQISTKRGDRISTCMFEMLVLSLHVESYSFPATRVCVPLSHGKKRVSE